MTQKSSRRRQRRDRQTRSRKHALPAKERAPRAHLLAVLTCYAWASPTTALGLLAGVLTLATRGKVQGRRGALEFHGGFATWWSNQIGFHAMTLGHVILGKSAAALDLVREHEQAHVRQAERWGPVFIPAYLVASVLAWKRGGHYYRDNWFERDARRAAGEPD